MDSVQKRSNSAHEGRRTAQPSISRSPLRITVPTLHERIIDTLRDMIVEGELEAGTRIPELELCEQLGVSRTPLREAIKVLAHEGLISLMANRGAIVTTPTMPEVLDTMEMIGFLEGNAAILCARRASDAHLAAIAAVHQQLITFSREEALPEYFRANIRLHEMIVEGADNKILNDLHVKLGSQLRRVRSARVSHSSAAEREAFITEHQRIVDALLCRDEMAAFNAAIAHMASVVGENGPHKTPAG